jgi:hypothetical protein
MKNKIGVYQIILSVFIIVSFAYSDDPVSIVRKSKGEVDLFRKEETKSRDVKKGVVLYDQDKIMTKEASFCALKFVDDGSMLRIKENSTCIIEGKREEEHINKNIMVEIGSFFCSLFKPRGSFTVTTPTSVASVKGTQWWTIQLENGHTVWICIDGLLDLVNEAGKVLLKAGQTATYTSNTELPEIRLTRDDEVPELDDEIGQIKTLDVQFKDTNGNLKKLRIDYEEK